MNLAGRAGRWSAENWKKAVFGWLAFAVGAMVLGSVLGHVQMPDSQGPPARPRGHRRCSSARTSSSPPPRAS